MGEFKAVMGGRSRFVVESKSFEILVEDSGGKLKGCIWERSRGIASWIRFGEASLRCLLEGVEACCREVDDQRWVIEWMEGNKKFRMERQLNKAGRFILCFVRDLEAKKCSIIFPEGKGQASGWNSLAVRLKGLGVVPSEGLKFTNVPEVSLKSKGVSKVQWKEKGVETMSFADAVKSTPKRVGESVWLEVGEEKVCGRLDQLRHCLVGRWGIISVPLLELEYVRSWTRQNWEVKGKMKIAVLGRGILMFDFELSHEAECVLARGKRSIKENCLILDRWNPEVGCSYKYSNAVEAWVRVVGLPLNFWSLEVFKRIRDGCRGFIAVDEDIRSLSELQWARILVKRVEWEVPNSAHIVLGSGCFSLLLWWESPPWFTQVVPAESSSGKDGLRVGEEVDGSHCVACCGSQREKVEYLRMQSEVQDVALAGGKPPILSVEVSVEETNERGWVGGSADLVGGGRESSSNNMDVLGCGPEGLCSGPRCGPLALIFEEAQGRCHVSRDPRPIHLNGPLSCSEGVSGEAVGLF